MEVRFNDPIGKLNLSARATNGLRRVGVNTVEEFLKTSDKEIQSIYGIGVMTINEIRVKKKNLEKNMSFNLKPVQVAEVVSFQGDDKIEYIDIKIENLGMSRRSYNGLKGANINLFSQLIKLCDEDIIKIRNLGAKSLEEIKAIKYRTKLTPLKEIKDHKNKLMERLNKDNRNFIINLSKDLEFSNLEILPMLLEKYITEKEKEMNLEKYIFNNNELLHIILKDEVVKRKYENLILNLIDEKNYGLHIEEIIKSLPESIKDKNILDIVLNDLLENDEIDFVYDDRLMIKRKTFKETDIKFLTRQEFNILKYRISGKSMGEIGKIYGVSRQRIRQAQEKAKNKLVLNGAYFQEDDYKYILSTYMLEEEDFVIALGNSDIFNYLKIRYGLQGNKKLEDILDDRDIPVTIKKQFEKVVYKDYVKIGDKRVKKTKEDLVIYALKTYARNDIHLDEFKEKYLKLVEDLGVNDIGNIGIAGKGMDNWLGSSNNVLWKFKKKIRYYNQGIYDFTDLLEDLNLNQYMNVEYSSYKFFDLYPELMKTYDIRDEYELHNLLKKICSEDEYPHIGFKRMPTIQFGKVDRDKQVEELLFMLAPIPYYDFVYEYEKKYGFAANSVQGSQLKGIEKYLHDGEYIIDFPDIPEKTKNTIISNLDSDIYFIDDLMNKIRKIDPKLNRNRLNPRSIKSLGFINYENYVISEKHASASKYFNYLLTNKDMFDINRLDHRIKQESNFLTQLYNLKKEYEIIEYEPGKYINFSKLSNFGIRKADLDSFSKSVSKFLGEGKYFTISSLRDKGFRHYLDELGFKEWFYTSLLIEDKENISYTRVGGNKIMFTGKYDFNFEDVIESIVYEQEDLYISIYDLEDLLREKYKIFIEIYKLISIIKSSDMHYDAITETVYGDYEIYYEVI